MCSIEDHGVVSPSLNNDASSGGGRLLTPDSLKYMLVLLGIKITLFDI